MADDVTLPDFCCYRKACGSKFTQSSPPLARSLTGVQTNVIVCENCLHAYEILWTRDRRNVRAVTRTIPPWSTEGKRRLKALGLYDPADPRVYEDGILPVKYKPKSARR